MAAPPPPPPPPAPTSVTPTLADHQNRLQHFICCIADKGDALATKLRISTDCCCDTNTLILLNMYWHALVCYDPGATYNCLTQAEVDAMWNHISCLCGICFAPYGSTYILPRFACPTQGIRITEDGNARVTELGEPRITEC